MLRHPTSPTAPSIPQSERPQTWSDRLIMLLHFAAGIEHSLMVEYLYAAYSLGGDQVPAGQQDLVRQWRRSILTIAREEMGHLLTVQNVLTLLGGPITWPRESKPAGKGKLKVKMVLTAEGTSLNHVVDGEIDLD